MQETDEKETKKDRKTIKHKVLTAVGIVLCVIFIPMLIINVTLIIKSYTEPDKMPSVGGFVPMIVLTDSMYPFIHSGDLVICKTADAETIDVGDVIAYFDPQSASESVVIHRVEEVINESGEISFITKGDANNAVDADPIPEENLVGVYHLRISGAGNGAMFMRTTQGLILCVIFPLILLVGYDVLRRRRYENAKKEDTAALMAELEALKAQTQKNDEAPKGESALAEEEKSSC